MVIGMMTTMVIVTYVTYALEEHCELSFEEQIQLLNDPVQLAVYDAFYRGNVAAMRNNDST